jgi:predicted transglutaminase-like cysteine proteinase
MRSVIQSFVSAGFALLSLTGCQSAEVNFPTGSVVASSLASVSLNQGQPPRSSSLPSGRELRTLPPGFINFCLRERDQCDAPKDQPETAHMDDRLWAMLRSVNDVVNAAITPKSDREHYGRAEYWALATDGFGDCEDYALTKRKSLIEQGVPSRSLRIAIVRTRRGERHAVLTVATDKGDYVMDNLRLAILPWRDAGYVWLSRQGSRGGWDWVALDG